jgi:hypothetical protein
MSESTSNVSKEFSSMLKNENYTDIICPVCGYYCLGKGGYGCIDKPLFVFPKLETSNEKV